MAERLRIFPVFQRFRRAGQCLLVVPRRCAGDAPKDTVELRERLKADLESNLADAKLRVNKQVFSLFHSHAPDILHKGDACCLAEDVTEVFCA
jgi:hypothetical protein